MWPRAWTAAPLPSGRQRASRTRTPGRPSCSASQSVVARMLGSGQASHRRYHTAVVAPFLPDPERLAAVREALPALGAGIYLNTGSVGPLPGRDRGGDGRDRRPAS